MQRLGDGFLVKRMIPMPLPGGGMADLYELPNGQWQFGKGREATVVTSMEQVADVTDANAKEAIAKWIDRTKSMPVQPVIGEGPKPVLSGHSTRDQLSRAIANMPEEAVNRILMAITQTMGPIADSITQEPQVNSYGDGFGQDLDIPVPGQPFTLPPDAEWVNPSNPASGYYTPYVEVKNHLGEVIDRTVVRDAKGNPSRHWNPTPAFHQALNRPEPVSYIDAHPTQEYQGKDAEQELEEERERAKELVGAGSGKRRRR